MLTKDVEKFADSISDLYSNVSKPILDICIYALKLSGKIGSGSTVSMLVYMTLSGVLLTMLQRPAA